MKTNTMMRCASAMLLAALITTSFTTTTFAKYTTQGSAQDSARVAKWGVVVTTEGKLFDKTYLSGNDGGTPGAGVSDGENNTGLSVESTESVVAPGTRNTEGLTFKVEGRPEVDVEVSVHASTTKGDVYLNGMGLPDVTTADITNDTFNADRYFPVKFDLERNGKVAESDHNLSMSQLVARLNGLTARYDAGTNLASEAGFGTYVITWHWDYEGNDKADTLLANLNPGVTEIQGMSLKEGSQYNLQTDIKIDVVVTQVD
ncbi:MAG: hypothetical protein IKU28_02355 [Erysipelotrichaceae bacterium]|nr:hypothetical protein [Erysipelotrichaceae bacterium]